MYVYEQTNAKLYKTLICAPDMLLFIPTEFHRVARHGGEPRTRSTINRTGFTVEKIARRATGAFFNYASNITRF
jgi:hypothetical protein